jgi:rRNA maturation endonuclease Nob1
MRCINKINRLSGMAYDHRKFCARCPNPATHHAHFEFTCQHVCQSCGEKLRQTRRVEVTAMEKVKA